MPKDRFTPDLSYARPKLPAFQVLVMVDPDATDEWGHFLAYDKRIAEAAKSRGIKTALLCNQDLDSSLYPDCIDTVIPCFSVFSWTVGNKTKPQAEHLSLFAEELEGGMERLGGMFPDDQLCLFHYLGSAEVAEILDRLLLKRPRFRAIVNLFYASQFSPDDAGYTERWKSILYRLRHHPRLYLLCSTPRVRADYLSAWEIDLPVMEQPSTTFGDQAENALPSRTAQDRPVPPETWKIIFPGGARDEKGFDLSLAAADALRTRGDLELTFRIRRDKVAPGRALRLFDTFDPDGITILDQPLSDAEFIDMLAGQDVLILPYLPQAFRNRPSGLLMDALLLNKPVVVLQGTWLADLVGQLGIGVAVEESADGILQGLDQVLANYTTFIENGRKALAWYMQENSWHTLISRFIRMTSPSCPVLPTKQNHSDLLGYLCQTLKASDDSLLLTLCASAILVEREKIHPLLTGETWLSVAVNKALDRQPRDAEIRQFFDMCKTTF